MVVQQTQNIILGPIATINLVGDVNSGKYWILYYLTENCCPPPDTYAGVGGEFCNKLVSLNDGIQFKLTLWQHDCHYRFEKVRANYYTGNKPGCFLLCFSIADFGSFKNIEEKWFPEICQYYPDAPIILVGTMSDLRVENPTKCVVSVQEARHLQSKIKALAYIECSVKNNVNMNELFDEALQSLWLIPEVVNNLSIELTRIKEEFKEEQKNSFTSATVKERSNIKTDKNNFCPIS